MQTFSTLFDRELNRIIEEEINRLKNLLSHNTYERVDEFRYAMGKIAAYENMSSLIEEAKKSADQSNRSQI